MGKRPLLLLLALAPLSIPPARAALDTTRFTPRTLSSWEFSIRFSDRFPRSAAQESIDSDLTSLATQVQYTGQVRELPAEKKKFIGRVARDVIGHSEVADFYHREIEVKELGLNYWIAVQDEVLPHLDRELKPGESMRIFYHFAGVARNQQPVYLMIEFDATTPPARSLH